jgi:aminoglycoside phosphotransferase (APT) family kinase protein
MGEAPATGEAFMERKSPNEPQLRTLVSKHFSAPLKRSRVVHHHCNTHVYLTLEDNTRAVVRICDGPWWTEKADKIAKFKSEQFAWDMLKQVDGIITPQVIAIETDESVLPYPFLIMTHVPGTPMWDVFPKLSQDEQISLLRELGAVAHSIHALPIPKAVPDEVRRWGKLSGDLHEYLRELVSRGLIANDTHDRLQQLLGACSSRLTAMDEDTVFLHGDLHFGNILLEQNDNRWSISSLVDAELAGIGPRGRELTALEQFSFRELALPGMREAFLRGYGDGYGRDDYSLAYLVSELDADFPNTELLRLIESTDISDGLDWVGIFSDG